MIDQRKFVFGSCVAPPSHERFSSYLLFHSSLRLTDTPNDQLYCNSNCLDLDLKICTTVGWCLQFFIPQCSSGYKLMENKTHTKWLSVRISFGKARLKIKPNIHHRWLINPLAVTNHTLTALQLRKQWQVSVIVWKSVRILTSKPLIAKLCLMVFCTKQVLFFELFTLDVWNHRNIAKFIKNGTSFA